MVGRKACAEDRAEVSAAVINEAQVTALLFREEGEVLHAYPDSKGLLTIGIGRLIDVRKSGGISQDESRYLLRNDIHRKTAECERAFEWWPLLDDVRQQVILCMVFQMGTAGVMGFHQMCLALGRGDYARAATEMLDSDWAHEDSPARANRMANIMKTGVWPQ